jgi:F-type H+-transporting ATPase subunit a
MNDLLHNPPWRPFAAVGLNHPFFELNSNTLIYTWVALGIILFLSYTGRIILLQYPQTLTAYGIRSLLKSFRHMIIQATDHFISRYYFFITVLFIFIFICNSLILIPGCEEPTRDLNTTLALALLSFLYTQKETLKAHGFIGFIQEYMKMPFKVVTHKKYPLFILVPLIGIRALLNVVIGIISLPLEIMSKSASIISLSFRLFGNIFAGSLITTLLRQFVAGSFIRQALVTIIPVSLVISLFFGIFESFIQAYVFAMLSLTYLSMGIAHSHKEPHA